MASVHNRAYWYHYSIAMDNKTCLVTKVSLETMLNRHSSPDEISSKTVTYLKTEGVFTIVVLLLKPEVEVRLDLT